MRGCCAVLWANLAPGKANTRSQPRNQVSEFSEVWPCMVQSEFHSRVLRACLWRKRKEKCYYKALLTETMKPSHQLLQASSLCSLHDWFVSKDMWKETLSAPLHLPDQGCYRAQWRKGKAVNSMQRHTLDRQTVSETVTRKLSHANWWAIK